MSRRTRSEQVTEWQLLVLMYGILVPTAQLYLVGVTARTAGRDAWMAAPLAAPVGLGVLFLLQRLLRRYPGESLVRAAGRLPRGLGRLVPLPLLLWLTHSTGTLAIEFAQFISTSLLPLAPIGVIVIPAIVVGAYAVYLGIETIARVAEILVPPMTAISALILVLTLPHFSFQRLEPILADGPTPVVRAALGPASRYAELVLLGFVGPHLVRLRRFTAVSLTGWLAITLGLFFTGLGTMGVWGLLAGQLTFPFYSLGTLVELGEYLPRLDVITTLLWTGGMFVKFALFLYAEVGGWADWLGLDDHRPLVPWAAVVTVVIGLTLFPGESDLVAYISGLFPVVTLAVTLGTLAAVLLPGAGGPGRQAERTAAPGEAR